MSGLIDGIETVCKLAGADRETTRRIMAAAAGDSEKPGEKYLATRAAAGILECHPKTLLRLARQGKVKPIRRTARTYRWRASEIEALAAGTV